MSDLVNKISISLIEDNTDVNRRRWAGYIIKNKIKVKDLFELIHQENPVAIRFSWILGGICEIAPDVVYPGIPYFFLKRHQIKIANFNRSLAKMFWLCGVPEKIEAEAIDELFKWLLDAKTIVTTKTYALFALDKLTEKHKELKNELKVVIEDQLGKNTASFDKHAIAVLKKLREPSR